MTLRSNPGNAVSSGGGTIEKRELFTASGTWTKSSKFAGTDVWITAIGGGGSGNNQVIVYGGDGGEFVYDALIDVSATGSETVTIGSGGAAQAGTAAGNSGGVTSFGALLSVSGGAGGSSTKSPTGGASGTLDSAVNSAPLAAQDNACPFGGNGGQLSLPTTHGGGGGGIILDDSGTKGGDVSTVGFGGTGYGAGGGAQISTTSGAGAGGAMLITWMETL